MKKLSFILIIPALFLLIPAAAHAGEPFMLKDIKPGSGQSNPGFLTNINGILFFSASDGINGDELWKSDGTEAGSVIVKDINPAGHSHPVVLTNVNDTLFFRANDGTNGWELWKSDGTETGTVMVKDIFPDDYSNPDHLTDVNGTLFFRAEDGTNGYELWKSDGTETGTVMVKDIYPGSYGSSPYVLTNFNGTLFFWADDGTNGIELWKSDGTEAGTVIVKDINPAGGSGPEYSMLITHLVINGALLFYADNGTNGYELWKSDGTEAGTVMVKDIYPGAGHSFPCSLMNVNGTSFFTADDGINGIELWKSDGTEAGTVMVKDINPAGHSSPSHFTNVDNTLFFCADDGTNGTELWVYILKDECEDAMEVDLGPTYYGSNYGATGNDLTSCAYDDFADVWYYFEPQVSGEFTIDAGADEFDTTLAVFNACGGNELACNDDFFPSTDSQVSLEMVKGKPYYIRVAGFDGQAGNYELIVSAGACTQWVLSDINRDCKVDMQDFALMASEWLVCNMDPPELCWQ